MQFLRNEVENEQRVSLASESFGFRELSQSNDMANSRKKSPKVGGSSKISTAADLTLVCEKLAELLLSFSGGRMSCPLEL
ncbi:hypothetical protein NQ317_015740 [Molorchus minor]|uniref:Uncharacterized protein n=1 Tax=Molorchus minor TaxID=1323400 RepID=A0ABQ9JBM4_9CUCU|nr:hypothetical protein NQ317_015740 [Molorchus minor]